VNSKKAARLRHRGNGVEARELDEIADHVSPIANLSSQPPQAIALRAEGDTCTVARLTACGTASVLALCRLLVATGVNPATRIEAWRGDDRVNLRDTVEAIIDEIEGEE
jgi:hypothetical protein